MSIVPAIATFVIVSITTSVVAIMVAVMVAASIVTSEVMSAIELTVSSVSAVMSPMPLVVLAVWLHAMATSGVVTMPVAVVRSVSWTIIGLDDDDFGLHSCTEDEMCHRCEVVRSDAAQFELEARFELLARLGIASEADHDEGDAGRDNTLCATRAQFGIAI